MCACVCVCVCVWVGGWVCVWDLERERQTCREETESWQKRGNRVEETVRQRLIEREREWQRGEGQKKEREMFFPCFFFKLGGTLIVVKFNIHTWNDRDSQQCQRSELARVCDTKSLMLLQVLHWDRHTCDPSGHYSRGNTCPWRTLPAFSGLEVESSLHPAVSLE